MTPPFCTGSDAVGTFASPPEAVGFKGKPFEESSTIAGRPRVDHLRERYEGQVSLSSWPLRGSVCLLSAVSSCISLLESVGKDGSPSDSAGSSGGILCVWEATIFKTDYATVSDNFIAIYGTWISSNSKVLIVVIYAPQPLSHKRVLWDYISSLIARWNEETIVMGDFNEVRSIDERFGSMFNQSSSRLFNHFITSSGLLDVKLEGYSFTWAHPSATKMSKLDRFLVSE
nr:RNA-directed DNA polymerase, eukaryota [Tanacetum cinerariifolium]